jgi:hypothetical protein
MLNLLVRRRRQHKNITNTLDQKEKSTTTRALTNR